MAVTVEKIERIQKLLHEAVDLVLDSVPHNRSLDAILIPLRLVEGLLISYLEMRLPPSAAGTGRKQ